MSKLYAAQKGKANFEVTSAEVRCVLAILLISGYAPLPLRYRQVQLRNGRDRSHGSEHTAVPDRHQMQEMVVAVICLPSGRGSAESMADLPANSCL